MMSLIIMRLKQIMLFGLVILTIYSTLLFYILMTVPDSRLHEIDYLQNSKFMGDRVLYMDKIMHLHEKFHHFTISLLRFSKAKPSHCPKQHPEKALLIISASAFDMISIYGKLLRELQAENNECSMPQVFVFKKTRPLILSTQQNINKYAIEIGQIIKYITIEGKYDLSIFTHQQGAILTLAYLTRRTINILFKTMIEKISSLVFVDLAHPFMRVLYDPPFRWLNKLKKEVVSSKERVQIFNKLRIVIINTYKQENNNWKFYFPYKAQKYVFSNTAIISSRQMYNIHYYLPPNSLTFPPLIRRIGHFFSRNFNKNMTISEIQCFFRQGASYYYETIENAHIQFCAQHSYNYQQEYSISFGEYCVQLSPVQLKEQQILLVYSSYHFQMYSSSLLKIYPFDNLTKGSVYAFSQMKNQVYIINPNQATIFIAIKPIITPRNTLKQQSQSLVISSLDPTHYSIVSMCPNIRSLFPLHFPEGKNQRRILISGGDCFIQEDLLEQYSTQFFSDYSLLRNLIIFILVCSEYRKQNLSERLSEQFFINILMLFWRQQIKSKVLYSLYTISFALIVEYLTKYVIYLSSKLVIHRKWGNMLLLANAAICFVGLAFNLFNVWGWFLLSILGFINQQNLMIMLIKLYFLKDDIWSSNTSGVAQLGLVTMWLYTTSPSNKKITNSSYIPQRVFTGLLVVGVAFSLEGSGQFLDSMLTIFMKVLIVVKMFRIVRK